ncbi:apolipoprotein N-acyltransferase [Helicobacter sp. faydin-H8]|nr:apolipoprotein N-acyltransferase [Helicobacter anatolicus]
MNLRISFWVKNLQAFLFALFFCLPILSGAFLLSLEYEKIYIACNSIFAIFSIVVFLKIPKKMRFNFGFFVGILLFYWIGFSFFYSPYPFLMPFVSVGVALIYAGILGLTLWVENLFFRAIMLYFLGYVHPFYFDWFLPQSFFAYSIFGVDNFSFLCILLAGIVLANFTIKKFFFAGLLLVLAIFNTNFFTEYQIPFKISLSSTNIPQDARWDRDFIDSIIAQNFEKIYQAKKEKKEVIVLPETAFPMALNMQPYILEALKNLSKDIVIITGGMRLENHKSYNSTYIFTDNKVEIIDKVVLAPFGERIPLPDFLAKYFYKIFFGAQEGLESAQIPRDFILKNQKFRNAICYEGTSSLLYQGNPKYLIMISNNAWFFPSIEPYFQQILLKYRARKHGSIIFHSANFSNSMIIFPTLFSRIKQ